MRGDIETPWAGRAKEYAWSLMERHAPRKITPSDIDYLVECRGHFLVFEMKSVDAPLPYGQRLMLTELLARLTPVSRVVVIRHPPIDRVVVPADVLAFETWRWNGGRVETQEWEGAVFARWYARWFDAADYT